MEKLLIIEEALTSDVSDIPLENVLNSDYPFEELNRIQQLRHNNKYCERVQIKNDFTFAKLSSILCVASLVVTTFIK